MADPQTHHLIREAERDAQRVSAFARLAITALAAGIFLTAGGLSLPVAPIVLTYLGSYGAVSVASAILARPRFFHPHLSLVFTAIDGAALALLVGAALRATGTPYAFHAAVPGFVFIFCILILSSMRYTVGPVLMVLVSFSATWLAFTSLVAPLPAAQARPEFFFGTTQNAARWGFLVIATGLAVIAVRRRRRTLERAIAAAHARTNLSRYLPPRVAEVVAAEGLAALGTGRTQEAAVLFIDIRGFTALSEHMPPEDLGAMLSAFRGTVSEAIDAQGGIVEKFIGDAVMAVFGVPEPRSDHAGAALACIADIRARLETWNSTRRAAGLPAIAVSMGAHSGPLFAGAIGTEERIEFTVLGDTVNIAARLQEAAKQTASGAVASDALIAQASPALRAAWAFAGTAVLRGRTDPLGYHALKT